MNPKDLLHQHHLRITPTRVAILTALETTKQPIDIETIKTYVRGQKVTCDLVTIYRVIETFVKNEMVTQVDFQDGKYRYEIAGDHHHHLVCNQCGNIQDIHEPCMAIDPAFIQKMHGFTITRHQLEFFGLCKKCTKRPKEA